MAIVMLRPCFHVCWCKLSLIWQSKMNDKLPPGFVTLNSNYSELLTLQHCYTTGNASGAHSVFVSGNVTLGTNGKYCVTCLRNLWRLSEIHELLRKHTTLCTICFDGNCNTICEIWYCSICTTIHGNNLWKRRVHYRGNTCNIACWKVLESLHWLSGGISWPTLDWLGVGSIISNILLQFWEIKYMESSKVD